MIRCACAMGVAMAGGQVSAADVSLELRNGDRVSGTIVREATNQIVLSNAWSREIVLPMQEVAKRTTLFPPFAPVTSRSNAVATVAIIPTNSALAKMVSSPALTATLEVKPEVRWAGDFMVGLDVLQNTTTRQIYYGRAKVTYSHQNLRNIIDYSGSYGRTEGITDANRMDGANKTDLDVGRKYYLYNLLGVGYDLVRKIDMRYEIGPGVGYHLLKTPNVVLNTEAGFDFQSEYRSDNTVADRFLARLGENGTWKINSKFSLDHRFEFFPSFDNLSTYRFRAEATLRYWLWNNLTLNLSLAEAYDAAPAQGVPPNDLQIRSAIGFKF